MSSDFGLLRVVATDDANKIDVESIDIEKSFTTEENLADEKKLLAVRTMQTKEEKQMSHKKSFC